MASLLRSGRIGLSHAHQARILNGALSCNATAGSQKAYMQHVLPQANKRAALLQHRAPFRAHSVSAVLQSWSHVAQPSLSPLRPSGACRQQQLPQRMCRRAGRLSRSATGPLVLAMVNVDFASPSLVLGAALIACGIVLLQARNMQQRVSRDADIVVAAMISIVGSTLIFQGWRLDPLLLLCQALTTSVAFWYGMETFKLRAQVDETSGLPPQLPPPEEFYQPQQYDEFAAGASAARQQRSGYLPPGQRPAAPWEARGPGSAAGAQDGYASSSGAGAPWGQQQQSNGRGQYDETIRYDYYGNPIEQPRQYEEAVYDQQYEQQYSQQGYGPGPGDSRSAPSSSQPYADPQQYGSGQGQYGPASADGTGQYAGAGQYGPASVADGAGYQDSQRQPEGARWGGGRPVAPQPRADVYEKIDDWE